MRKDRFGLLQTLAISEAAQRVRDRGLVNNSGVLVVETRPDKPTGIKHFGGPGGGKLGTKRRPHGKHKFGGGRITRAVGINEVESL